MSESPPRAGADRFRIVLLRKSLRARLWIGGIAALSFVALVLTANAVIAPGKSPAIGRIGHDFLPFYAAGTFVRDGNPRAMYDLGAMRAREQQIARDNGLARGDGFGPFWNPPFYALPFAPLAMMPFRPAMLTWLGINLAALVLATASLCRMLGTSAADWHTWGLVPLLLLASSPLLLAFTHGQNTFCSLLLLTLATLAWRARRGVMLGLVVGLLAYKPQLAALVGVIALIDLGWKVALGAAVSGGVLILTSVFAMPGILETYAAALPKTLHFMQVEHAYTWERHVTLKAFWRLLVQGYAAGDAGIAVTLFTTLSAAVFGITLFVAAFRRRMQGSAGNPDRLIGATIATMPLVMPFYFDYDLLLLAIPAVLIAREGQAGRRLVSCWCALYLCLIVNPDVAERSRVNLAVPLLAMIAWTLLARALRRRAETAQCTTGARPADHAVLPGGWRMAA